MILMGNNDNKREINNNDANESFRTSWVSQTCMQFAHFTSKV